MPGHCTPCPPNTITSCAREPRAAVEIAGFSSSAKALSFRIQSEWLVPITATRWPKCARLQPAIDAMSRRLSSRSSFSSATTQRAALARRDGNVLAERGNINGQSASRRTSAFADGAAASDGGSDRTACALVPLIPNELTPATRGADALGQGALSV